jgi:DNA-binding MarR family transcriptional regulator
MEEDKEQLAQHILQMATRLFEMIGLAVPQEWLSSDLTVTQLRVMVTLQTAGSAKMSDLAAGIGVALPTATGIVDNLVNKGLVIRETSPRDRRVVICRLSPQGIEMIGKLWEFSGQQIKKMLEGLSYDQLQKAVDVVDILYNTISQARQSQERESSK